MKQLILIVLMLSWIPQAQANFLDAIKKLVNFNCVDALAEKRIISEFKAAKQNDQVKPLANVSANGYIDLVKMLSSVQLGKTFTPKVLNELMQGGDELYAYEGKLIRYRLSDSSIAIIPEEILFECVASNLITNQDLRTVRLSWPEKYVFPSRPDLKSASGHLEGARSKWSKDGDNFIYEVRIKAKSILGTTSASSAFLRQAVTKHEDLFFTLKITFTPSSTIYFLDQREFTSDQAKKFLRDLAEGKDRFLIQSFPMGAIAARTLYGGSVEIKNNLGITTETLQNIFKATYAYILLDI